MNRTLTRRTFLKYSALAAAGGLAAACAPTVAPTPQVVEKQVEVTKEVVVEKQVQVTVEVPTKRNEPALLAERVAAGSLPPVDERLPETPVVVGGREAIGVYGGELRMLHFDPVWFVSNYGLNAERMLTFSDLDLRTIVPNIFESWESSPDGKVWTIHMRKGMKWSDGEPLTAEDMRFWWEDVSNNPELSGGVASEFRTGGERMKVEYLDDFTFKCTFAGPFGAFPHNMTRWHVSDMLLPAHYGKRFHNKFTDQAELDKMVAEQGVDDWVALFWRNLDWGIGIWQGPDNYKEYPTLSAWIIIDRPQEGLYIWERNPFYWKVDLQGNQLPYLDNLRYDYVQNTEGAKLLMMQSELDYVGPHDVSVADYPLYKENESKANFMVGDYLSCMTDRYVLFPQHHQMEDPGLTEIIQHPNFIKALSVAIDRDEINESLFYGTARMGQLGPMPASKYYKPKYGEAWAQYDPELANQLLDEMGLDKRNAQGWRQRSDGSELTFNIEHAGARVGTSTHKFTEMVVSYWQAVGIKSTTKEEQESLYKERMRNGKVHCGVWHADCCTDLLLPIAMYWYIPMNTAASGTASTLWSTWWAAEDKTAAGLVEPPDYIKELYKLFDGMQATLDEDERLALGQQIFDWTAETPLAIGSVLESPAPLLFNKNLRNLPRPKSPVGWDSYGISTYHPEAFFYEGGVRA